MSFSQARAGRRFDPDQEGKRQVPLLVTNAVFSKLIKLGLDGKKTPVAMAQELFEEAYAERCMGKSLVTIAGDMAVQVVDDLRKQLAEAREEARRLGVKVIEMTEHGGAHLCRAEKAEAERDEARREQESMRTTRREECEFLRAEATKIAADRDQLRRERDHLVTENDGLKATVDQLRIEALDLVLAKPPVPTPQLLACEDGEANGNLPAKPAPPAIGRGTVKAVLAMRSMGATAAEIASDLALLRPIVDQVLRENRA